MNAAVLAVAAGEPVFVTLPLLVAAFAAAAEPCVAWFRDAHQFETLLMLPIDMDHLLAWSEAPHASAVPGQEVRQCREW